MTVKMIKVIDADGTQFKEGDIVTVSIYDNVSKEFVDLSGKVEKIDTSTFVLDTSKEYDSEEMVIKYTDIKNIVAKASGADTDDTPGTDTDDSVDGGEGAGDATPTEPSEP